MAEKKRRALKIEGTPAKLHMHDGSFEDVLVVNRIKSERDGEQVEVRSKRNGYHSGALVPADCIVR